MALQCYDITNQTVAAAGFPEPVTWNRTWAISWLAAAHAVAENTNQDRFGIGTDLNAFKTCDSIIERVQIMGRAEPVSWTTEQVTASG